MDIKKLFLLLGSALLLVLFGLMFIGPEKPKPKSSKAEQLSSLLAGGTQTDSSSGDYRRGQRVNTNSSVFDSDFAKAGINSYAEEEVTEEKKADGITPINPQTGKPYDDETMEQFDKLRLIFPGNELIPKKFSPEDKAKKDQEDAQYAQATTAFMTNTASKDQVQLYFNKQEKIIKDRLEIIEYLIDAQKEDGEYDKDGQFQKIMDGAQDQLKTLENQKTEAFRKYGL